jgi:hypothetical protein
MQDGIENKAAESQHNGFHKKRRAKEEKEAKGRNARRAWIYKRKFELRHRHAVVLETLGALKRLGLGWLFRCNQRRRYRIRRHLALALWSHLQQRWQRNSQVQLNGPRDRFASTTHAYTILRPILFLRSGFKNGLGLQMSRRAAPVRVDNGSVGELVSPRERLLPTAAPEEPYEVQTPVRFLLCSLILMQLIPRNVGRIPASSVSPVSTDRPGTH